ncbi:hypothetical protein [Sinorhizobium meliloti]|uniref:hypothetical protein n=1 Tax=Rhizobium meliloti TaxID=382 RepID=UPI001F2B0DE8|nr:hypothetical protein [Sinorhizobium meliloti]
MSMGGFLANRDDEARRQAIMREQAARLSGYGGYQGATGNSRDQLAEKLRAQILGQPMPQTIGGGMGMLGAGIASGITNRNAAFPTAPGGAKPSMMTGLANFFTGGRNGGLY